MSAICGIYHFDGESASRDCVERMLTALAHNGPDGQGTWLEGPIGLRHSMLFSTPESLYEKLPQRDNEERLAGNIFTLEPPIRLLVL